MPKATKKKAKSSKRKSVSKNPVAKKGVKKATAKKVAKKTTKKAVPKKAAKVSAKKIASKKVLDETVAELNGDGVAVEFVLKYKIKGLVELAKEQGYLSHDDVEESLPGKKPDQKQLDQVYIELRKHEVRIVDQADVDSVLPGGHEERDVVKEKEKDKYKENRER